MGDWILNNLTLIAVILAVGGLVFKLGRWVESIDKVRELTEELSKDVKKIGEQILEIFKRLPPPVPVAGESPLHLTDFGEEISEYINATEWAEQIAPKLREKVEGKSKYEIQELCFSYVQGVDLDQTHEQFTNVHSCAFDKGIEVKAVLKVLGVELRDKLFEIMGLDINSG